MIVTFSGIGDLTPGQPITYESPYGSTVGYVAAVEPGVGIAVYNGAGTWHFTAEHFATGMFTIADPS